MNYIWRHKGKIYIYILYFKEKLLFIYWTIQVTVKRCHFFSSLKLKSEQSIAQVTIQGHCNGCFRSKSPVPPFTTFPTTMQAEGEFNLSCKPIKKKTKKTMISYMFKRPATASFGLLVLNWLFLNEHYYSNYY